MSEAVPPEDIPLLIDSEEFLRLLNSPDYVPVTPAPDVIVTETLSASDGAEEGA